MVHLFTNPNNYFNALTLGSIFAMIAVGYTMVYGIVKLINFAHGEVFMFGAYFGYFVTLPLSEGSAVGLAIPLAVVAGMVGCAALGIVIDWTAYLPLRAKHRWPGLLSTVGLLLVAVNTLWYFSLSKKDQPAGVPMVLLSLVALAVLVAALLTLMGRLGPPDRTVEAGRLSALITAIGMSLALQTIAQMIWTPSPRAIAHDAIPAAFHEPVFTLLGAQVQGKELATWIVAATLTIVLSFLVSSTRIGKAMRACAIDKQTAALMGINVNHVIAFTFVVGSAMAAVAGIFMHLKGGVNIDPRYGYYPGVIAFAAAVLGGIGNIRGAMLGGMILGFVKAFIDAIPSWSPYSFAFAFGLMCIVIVFRPSGLLGRPEAKRA